MRFVVSLLSLLFAMAASGQPADSEPDKLAPVQVVSINVCADQLVIELASPAQILSLTHLSHDPAASHHHRLARRFPINRGRAEDVLPWQPDLVIAGDYTAPHTIGLLRSSGVQVEVLPIAESVEAVLANIQRVAGWLRRPARGRQLTRALRQRLARIAAENAVRTLSTDRPRAAVYDPNGYTVGEATLRGELLALSGWHNVATETHISHYGSLPLESLIRLAPDVLIASPYGNTSYSRAQAVTRHRALHRGGLDPEIINLHSRDTICGGPWLVDLIEQLAERRVALEQRLSSQGSRP